MAAKKTPNWRFQYIGDGPASTGLVSITRHKGNPDEDGVLFPNDEVVVASVDEAVWLRSLSNFKEIQSPTSDKATHKRAPAKKKPPAKPKGDE